MKLKHLSITSKNPQRSAQILAELTNGVAAPFSSKTMDGAWLCIWDKEANELIEFIPNKYKLGIGKYAAEYKLNEATQNFNSTHFLLETDQLVSHLQEIAEKYNLYHRFRPRFGGPLYEIWIEPELLVEFISNEIKNLSVP